MCKMIFKKYLKQTPASKTEGSLPQLSLIHSTTLPHRDGPGPIPQLFLLVNQ